MILATCYEAPGDRWFKIVETQWLFENILWEGPKVGLGAAKYQLKKY